MKAKLLIVALVVFGLTSCTQYTCPTYSKKDMKKQQKDTEVVKKEKV